MLNDFDMSQARKTSILLGIPTDFVRKDYFVTSAIQAITSIKNDYFGLVFQGGTSLSKGYQITQRMSEDIDFRIIQKNVTLSLGKSKQHHMLREFRHNLIDVLRKRGFQILNDGVKIFYEGRFMSIQASFPDSEKIAYLRPHIAIECFLGEPVLSSQNRNITTLTKMTLGDECKHNTFSVPCVALDETTAEKWVALTRRVANSQIKTRPSDKHLVRHLYDLYYLKTGSLLTGDYRHITKAIVEKDRNQFRKHNANYSDNPIYASEQALNSLFKNPKWRNHWDDFLAQMVYEKNKPFFDRACDHLQELSQEIFKSLKSTQKE